MSRSTTATTTHVLLKYSRSYPLASDQGTSLGPDAEWQHFVNPVMRLALDVKKSASGELESVRLRILWSMNSGTDSMDVDQQEVVFEDLDLLSFSTSASQSSQQKPLNQGLPLKAVYRDSVVGIRYLYRLNNSNSPGTYRRFQITFQSSAAASQFIDSIRYVCPCKVNPTPAPVRAGTLLPTTQAQASGIPQQKQLPESNAYIQAPRTQIVPQTPVIVPMPANNFAVPSYQFDVPPVCLPNVDFDNFSRPTTSSSTVKPSSSGNLKRPWNTDLPGLRTHDVQTVPASFNLSIPNPSAQLSISDPSLPSSNGTIRSQMPPPSISEPILQVIPGESAMTTQLQPVSATHETLMASLRESPALYGLSRVELENLVGEVVREEGFPKLLESLDSMWRVKGFLAC